MQSQKTWSYPNQKVIVVTLGDGKAKAKRLAADEHASCAHAQSNHVPQLTTILRNGGACFDDGKYTMFMVNSTYM